MTLFIIIGVIVLFVIFYYMGKDEEFQFDEKADYEGSISAEVTIHDSDKRLYDREFEVWYCDVGSKDRKDVQLFQDRASIYCNPEKHHEITGAIMDINELHNTNGYEELYSGLDSKNRKRWYFALLKRTLVATKTIEPVNKQIKDSEVVRKLEQSGTMKKTDDIIVPDGFDLVRRNTKKWHDLGFGDGDIFPGYGKIFDRIFEVWYCKIGSREKITQPDLKDKATLAHMPIWVNIEDLNNKNMDFDYLKKKQGYKKLFTAVDNVERKRWYFGMKDAKQTTLFTARAE